MDELTEQLIQRLLAAATRSSADDAPRLIAEARAEAEAEVKDLLKSALKAVLLRQTVAELERMPGAPAADTPPPAATSAEPAPVSIAPAAQAATDLEPEPEPVASSHPPAGDVEGDTACYVYGIARADTLDLPPDLTGVDGDPPLIAVRHNGLAAVTSAVRLSAFGQAAIDEHVKDLGWVEQKVHAHDRVVKAAMAAGPVIPCRFCTIVADEGEVLRLLRRHAATIRQTLDRIEGRREWGVKVVYSPDAADDAGGDEERGDDRGPVQGAAGRSYLLQKRRQGLRRSESLRDAQAAADECHRILSALSADAALLPTRDRGDNGRKLLVNAAYLVADAELQGFDAALAELQARHARNGISLERTGPWPPYNFARLSLTLEPEARQEAPSSEAAPPQPEPERAA